MTNKVDRSFYVLEDDTPVCALDCETAFNNLTEREKKYAHYFGQACWEGQLIVMCQVSPESPAIFALLYELFRSEPVDALRKKAIEALGWTESEFRALLVYAAGIYANGGNYKGYGDSKFIPDVEPAKFRALFENSEAFAKKPELRDVYERVEDRIFALDKNLLTLGFPGKGVTCYHSTSVTKEDSDFIDRFLKSRNLESWNTRLEKTVEKGKPPTYGVRLASVEEGQSPPEEFEGQRVYFKKGDYAPLLVRVNQWLAEAKNHAANERQVAMITDFIEHFSTGSLEKHKDASRHWVADSNPSVESYIGFLENYRDPAGSRSEFEGILAVVNKEMSKKFQALVDGAEEILQLLPWDAAYQKDVFQRPDFNALEVIALSKCSVPLGINLPNYNDVKQDTGFKNVSLMNSASALPRIKPNFLGAEDEDLFWRYRLQSLELQVGLHELLGHGSGKLFTNIDGQPNFDREKVKDLVTGEKVKSWYEKGETFSSKFGAVSNAYEECRAEAAGYFLCCFDDAMKIFGYEGREAEDVRYVNWLQSLRAGLAGLETYSPETGGWGKAHNYARYVIMCACMAAGQGFVAVDECTDAEGKPDLKFRLDRSKIQSVGKNAVGELLRKLQAYKSTGNAEEGVKFFKEWGTVGEEQLRWREVVLARRKPQRICVQANTFLEDNGDVVPRVYPETFEGVVRSFVERYKPDSVEDLLSVWKKDAIVFGLP